MYDIWRVNLGDDPPAKVPPLKIRLKPGAKPYKTKARKYPPELQRFLEDFNNTLVSLGWVYENPDARNSLIYDPPQDLHTAPSTSRLVGCCTLLSSDDGAVLRISALRSLISVDR
eukprot:jgi/Phyca11/102668/e_gw1.7.655.1